MTNRRIDAFFYGLFMDKGVLRKNSVEIVDPRQAYVDDYALVIGNRATLIPKRGARVFGMNMSVTHEELEKLYTAPGLEDYRAEALSTHLLSGGGVPAMCFNLLTIPSADEENRAYAAQLREALTKLNFPPEYISSIT